MSAKRLSAISIFTAFVIIASLIAAFLPQSISPQRAQAATVTVIFNTAGTTTWTAPAGITSITVECWGGGGKGGTRSTNGAGGGGGGGAYSMRTISVTPGNSYTVVVGAGSTTTAAGGDSYFISAATVMAKGGSSVLNNVATGAAGGSATAGVGTVRYSGGNGANGVSGSYGGGGGSSAGTASNGNPGSGSTGGAAPLGGGKGGNGRVSTQGNGLAGSSPGGGGGGGLRRINGTRSGGAGANGMVKITYATAEQLAIGTVSLWTTGDESMITLFIDPLAEMSVHIPVSDDNTLNDLVSLTATIYYDADGVYSAAEVPVSGDSQTCAILTWTKATNTLTIDAGGSMWWSVNNSTSYFPPLSGTEGTFEFHFSAGKVATQTSGAAKWHIHVVGTDSAYTDSAYLENIAMNWYGEIVVNTPVVDWGIVNAPLDFEDSDPSRETGISVTYISNGAFNAQVRSSTTWAGESANAVLKPEGNPGPNQFSLKADDDDSLDGAVLVPALYATFYSGTQTGESGTTVVSNSLWLKLGSPFTSGRYDGSIYYGIISQ